MHFIEENSHEGGKRHHHETPYVPDLRERRMLVQSIQSVLYHLHGLQTTGEIYCFGVYRTVEEAVSRTNEKMQKEPTTRFEVVAVCQ